MLDGVNRTSIRGSGSDADPEGSHHGLGHSAAQNLPKQCFVRFMCFLYCLLRTSVKTHRDISSSINSIKLARTGMTACAFGQVQRYSRNGPIPPWVPVSPWDPFDHFWVGFQARCGCPIGPGGPWSPWAPFGSFWNVFSAGFGAPWVFRDRFQTKFVHLASSLQHPGWLLVVSGGVPSRFLLVSLT